MTPSGGQAEPVGATKVVKAYPLTGCEFSGVRTLLAVAIVYVKRGRRTQCGEKYAGHVMPVGRMEGA
jgi:hypothetical protein